MLMMNNATMMAGWERRLNSDGADVGDDDCTSDVDDDVAKTIVPVM